MPFPGTTPRTALIFCSVLEEELAAVMAELGVDPPRVQLPQGLHDTPALLRQTVQEAVDGLEADHAPEAILFGYGLCSRGLEGIRARSAKLVLARAHDCITLLLGSRDRYGKYVQNHPGTYWYSVGWNRHHLAPGPERVKKLREGYVKLYGEDNADFLMEEEQAWLTSYDRSTFIDTGVGEVEAEAQSTEAAARWLGWSYDRQKGSLDLLRRLLKGEWDSEDFLVLEPGQTARMTADERVVAVADQP